MDKLFFGDKGKAPAGGGSDRWQENQRGNSPNTAAPLPVMAA